MEVVKLRHNALSISFLRIFAILTLFLFFLGLLKLAFTKIDLWTFLVCCWAYIVYFCLIRAILIHY